MKMIRVPVLKISAQYGEIHYGSGDPKYYWIDAEKVESVVFNGVDAEVLMENGNKYLIQDFNINELLWGVRL